MNTWDVHLARLLVDDVAVERALDGDLSYWALNVLERAVAIERCDTGRSAAQVADQLGIAKRTVQRHRRRRRQRQQHTDPKDT